MNSGIDESFCFVTHCFPRPTDNDELSSDELKTNQNVALDIEVVTPENSKLYAKTSRDTGICHLVIYAPHPCKFTPYNAGTEGRNDPVQKVHSAIRMDASLDYATRFIGKELPSQFFWRELAQRSFPVA